MFSCVCDGILTVCHYFLFSRLVGDQLVGGGGGVLFGHCLRSLFRWCVSVDKTCGTLQNPIWSSRLFCGLQLLLSTFKLPCLVWCLWWCIDYIESRYTGRGSIFHQIFIEVCFLQIFCTFLVGWIVVLGTVHCSRIRPSSLQCSQLALLLLLSSHRSMLWVGGRWSPILFTWYTLVWVRCSMLHVPPWSVVIDATHYLM